MSKQKLFINAKVIFSNKITAFLTEEGKIIKTGKTYELLKNKDEDIEVIDLKNQYVMPSFTDGHLHYFYYALQKDSIDLKNVSSIDEVYNKIKNKTKYNKDNNWITVINWDEEKFDSKYNMDRLFLDKISKTMPILVKRRCLHVAFANTKALELAKIDQNTPDPEGGKYIRDKDGNPTGVLQDESITVFDDLVLEKQKERFKEIIENSFNDFLKNGITTIHTDDFTQKKYRDYVFNSYLELANDKKLPIDITLQMRVNQKEDFEYYKQIREKVKDIDGLNTGPVKFMYDGSLGGRTAALRKPYTDDTTTKGDLLFDTDKLESLVDLAYQNNFQPAIHAIGLKAVENVVKIYIKMKDKYPNKSLRPIIVHASMIDDKLAEKIKKNNIVLSIQPTFISSDYKFAEKRLGKRRAKYLYRMRSLIEKGITLSGSSDAPVEDINPLLGVYASVKRKNPIKTTEDSWIPNEIIDIKKALQLYTIGPAFQSFEENIKGKIKDNYQADFITFNKNPLQLKAEELIDLKVQQVFKNSKLVYEN
jgi:predicted amidohydrolase YtcJ